MFDKRHIDELRERLERYQPPLLSLYATVNPARPDVNPQAVYLRVKNTLKGLDGVPAAVVDRVLAFFEGRAHDSRSLALFANDQDLEYMELSVELRGSTDGPHLEAHWGEPYLTPLLEAANDHERYGIAFVDRDHLRFFRTSMGEIEELLSEERSRGDEITDELQSNKQENPEYVPSRGGAEAQLAQEHVKEHQRAFYKEMAGRLQELTAGGEIRRLVLMGPEGDTHLLLSALPAPLAGKVVALVAGPSSPKAGAHEILEKVEPTIRQIESEQEDELLDRIRERGIWGFSECLHALQEGRIYTLAVPEGLHREAYVESESRYVALSKSEAEQLLSNGGKVEKIDLGAALPRLASSWGAELEFVHGEAEKRLVDEFGGMAGLKRW